MSLIGLGEASIALIWMVIMALVYGLILLIGIISYVLASWGMHSIAKRRGISKPWLAWLPFGSDWILGCISDQYQLVAKGKNKSRRKILLGLSVAMVPVSLFYAVAYAVFMMGSMGALSDNYVGGKTSELLVVLVSVLMVVSVFLLLVLVVIYMVFMYMALFDLFQSCNPDTGVLFLILSIVLLFVASIELSPLFIFLDRKKDKGMPVADDGFELPEAAE